MKKCLVTDRDKKKEKTKGIRDNYSERVRSNR